MAKVLLGCYRTGEANDPAIYSGAIIAVLSDYPLDVVRRVVDPRSGIPSTSKWLPTVAEVKDACEAQMAPIRREQARDALAAERAHQLPPPVDNRAQRPSYEELQHRCAEVGIFIGGKKTMDEPPEKLMEKYGLTQEQWDAVPNARR